VARNRALVASGSSAPGAASETRLHRPNPRTWLDEPTGELMRIAPPAAARPSPRG